jgi:2-oxoglutarate dehydrogenase E2 component (dihydrolipoamide succinyltransferase)
MPVDIIIPTIAESVTSGVIQRWLKKDGERVQRDETVLELETDKVTMEIPAPAGGVISIKAKTGQTVKVGEAVGSIDPAGTPSVSAPASSTASASAPASSSAKAEGAPKSTPPAPAVATAAPAAGHDANGDVRATPLARKLAAEHGVDMSKIVATGAGGRVREQDVLAFVESRAGRGEPARPAPKSTGGRGVTRERLTPLRQRIAQRLVQAQHTAAMLTTFNECDMGAVMELRAKYKEEFEKKHGIGLGFMGFFVKAAASALQAFPLVNAFLAQDESGEVVIEKHEYCDIAVAVSTPKGLVVPVLRNTERMGFAQVESGIKDLATRAREGKLGLDEMQGGTFTITNGGIFGSLLSTPILNPPQSAILGMHAIKSRPIEYPGGSGQIALRPMMNLALSYDHRIIDGAEAVQFLVRIKQAIEDPQRLLLGM